ncbi:SMI1/KNR4 family protein [Pedobacter sp. N23S346]|uniref:SMI1/KNR4 family protein n=1 Tax=Pedobacter sp. N23S346 TaxID=3402750 RepID=UPI003ACF2DBF
MNWKFVEKLENESNIQLVESALKVTFPKDFLSIVKKYNHGTADPGTFDTKYLKGRSFGELLDFNLDREYNILSEYELIKDRLPNNVYPFAGDAGGNYLCFDFNKNEITPRILFWDHEQKFHIVDDEIVINDEANDYEQHYLDFIAVNFTELLAMLYKPDGDEDDDEDAEILYDGMDD